MLTPDSNGGRDPMDWRVEYWRDRALAAEDHASDLRRNASGDEAAVFLLLYLNSLGGSSSASCPDVKWLHVS